MTCNNNIAYLGAQSASAPLLKCLESQLSVEDYATLSQVPKSTSSTRDPGSESKGEESAPVIISSDQESWHARLAAEGPGWLSQAMEPAVEEALTNIDIRYCSTYSESIILATSLSLCISTDPASIEPDPDAADADQEPPPNQISPKTNLVIAHDLLRIFLVPAFQKIVKKPSKVEGEIGVGADEEKREEEGKENAAENCDADGEERSVWKFKPRLSEKHYLSLMAAMRQACDQLSPTTLKPIQLIIYEPLVSPEIKILPHDSYPGPDSHPDPDHKLGISLEGRIRDGLEWLFDVDVGQVKGGR